MYLWLIYCSHFCAPDTIRFLIYIMLLSVGVVYIKADWSIFGTLACTKWTAWKFSRCIGIPRCHSTFSLSEINVTVSITDEIKDWRCNAYSLRWSLERIVCFRLWESFVLKWQCLLRQSLTKTCATLKWFLVLPEKMLQKKKYKVYRVRSRDHHGRIIPGLINTNS